METRISEIVGQYESGRISRRQLVSRLSAFAMGTIGLGGVALAAKRESTFSALGLNHPIASVRSAAGRVRPGPNPDRPGPAPDRLRTSFVA